MTIFQSLILGIVQGITEFLPISSSAHLIIFPHIMHWSEHSLAFDTTLHLGTACALIVFFFYDLKTIVLSLFKDLFKLKRNVKDYSIDSKIGLMILVGSIPASILGILFEDTLENSFRGITYIITFLTIGSILMYVSEYFSKLIKKDNTITYKKSILVGLFQSLALLPGVSRSGATISGGMLLSLTRESAARFSFLLSIPIVFTAGVFKLLSTNTLENTSLLVLGIGFLSSFITGAFAIKFLLKFLKTNKLYPFVIYRVILAVILLLII